MQTGSSELLVTAPLWKRFSAFLVDMLIGGLILFGLVGLLMIYLIAAMAYVRWELLENILERATETAFYIYVLLTVLSFIWFLLYLLLRDSLKNGQSWGKRLFGLKVVSVETGRPCSRGGSFTRNFPGLSFTLIFCFIPLVGWLLLLVEPVAVATNPDEGLRIGDRWARTRVVQV